MKKVLAWGLALLMAGTLAGCGSGSGSPAPASTAAKAPAGTAAAPAGGASASGETFTLGLICPLSGSSAVSGQILKNATEMAVNEINEAGGIDGRIQIVLAEVDDEGVPANSVTAMQKLVEQDKVGAVIGAQASSCTLANMEITKAAKIPQITPASSNVAVTQSGNPYIYQMTATDELHMRNIMKFMSAEKGAKSFAILYESSDFGTGGFKIASNICGEFGLDMVASEVYNAGDTDFSVVLGKMQKANPDFFIFWGYHTEVAMICKQMQQYGISYPCIGQGYNSPELTNLGGAAVEGIMIDTAFDAANPDERVQEFDRKYTELYGEGYDQNAPQSYDAVYVIKDAIERCIADGKDYTDGETLNGYIASTAWDGVTGVTTFDENGRMNKDLLIITIENGEHKIIKN
ncbi:MAG: ABC transporter substrate-binding protein [Lachnospiraceae bacterium]|jgi:branched-chain amino acid transport system substrate-binding protein|nr:ABC transporter substrate-binding protein [Lachnospiraceae bacterium]